MAKVLIIDDDEMVCETLSDIVSDMGHQATCSFTLAEGLNDVLTEDYDLVLLDVRMPDGNGLDYLPAVRKAPSSPSVIILTAYGDADGAELAIKNGAWDYIEKPSPEHEMVLTLTRALQHREGMSLKKPCVALKCDSIVGNSPPMAACLDLLAKAANNDVNVLITGETGTGKELFALAIHDNSSRASSSFVVVDCTALPENLVESLLFGHEKGVFTGADKAKEGLIKQADGGTLFLDEVGELPLTLQKRFLRVLQTRRFRPLGSKQEVTSDFRLIAATNRNLEEMVSGAQFREDLYFRLQSLTVTLPPLRSRPEDLRDLVLHHMDRICVENGVAPMGFSPDFLDALATHDWPGNVRELINVLESVVSTAHGDPILLPQHLPMLLRTRLARKPFICPKPAGRQEDQDLNARHNPGGVEAMLDHPDLFPTWREYHDELERKYVEKLMTMSGGSVGKACRYSDLSRARLYQLLKKYKGGESVNG